MKNKVKEIWHSPYKLSTSYMRTGEKSAYASGAYALHRVYQTPKGTVLIDEWVSILKSGRIAGTGFSVALGGRDYRMTLQVAGLSERSLKVRATRFLTECLRQMPSKLPSYQERVNKWVRACFDKDVLHDKAERAHRFIEEAIELVQSAGITKQEVLQLTDYVFGRPVGEIAQEVGGVSVTLAALCTAAGVTQEEAAKAELMRIWKQRQAIRTKWLNKPNNSPLPQ